MDDVVFYVGDADLHLLGAAAAVAARFQAIRKGGRLFSDTDAQVAIAQGVVAGALLPLDDVSEVRVAIHASRETLARLRALFEDEGGPSG